MRALPYTYACEEFPGMEGCPGVFTAATLEETHAHIELHAAQAHGEDPANDWSDEDRRIIRELTRETGAA